MSMFGIIFSAVLLFIIDAPLILNAKETRIIGGYDVASGEFRSVVAIYVQTADSRFFCGGTLLSNQWVLTAAQCVNNAVLFTIQLGSSTLTSENPNRLTVATSEHVIHPDFDPETLANDIGLIKLRMPIEFTDYIEPIDFPLWQIEDLMMVWSLGWGQTSDYDPNLSEDLQVVRIATISNDECRMIYGNQIKDNMLCAIGNYNEGPCIGDTGGPLLESYVRSIHIVGISSFVSANGCESPDPSGYTRVYPYLPWIGNVTGLEVPTNN